ncbi:putative Segregation and condensation protein B [groundwater metagenome]|uniref:Putative Segregation and condensation protein B n=1 Tax=groundwater metagenome TaxID=717931 RepID=A0A098EAI7_9ZZZZ
MEDNEIKKLIEGALFISGRNLGLEDLARICGLGNLGKVRQIADELKKDYEVRDCAIKISAGENTYLMDIEENLKSKVSNFSLHPEITKGDLKILGFIAYHQPLKQAEVFKNLGYVYEHIKKLEDLKFIESYREKNYKILKTTKKFDDHFCLKASDLKANLKAKNDSSIFNYE